MIPKLADAITFHTEEDGAHYGAEDINLKPVKPVKSLDNVSYDGKVK
jgi:hypothetical protein